MHANCYNPTLLALFIHLNFADQIASHTDMLRASLLISLSLLALTNGFAPLQPRLAVPASARLAPRPAAQLPIVQRSCSSPAASRVCHAPAMMSEAAVTETSARSAVKAVGWRFTAGIVTACTSLFFTGSLATMYAIVGWDLFSKSITMFIGERLWNNVDWGKDKDAQGDSAQRSLAKAIAWRIFAATNTFFAAAVLSKGSAGAAGKIAGSDSVIKTFLFFFYERAWAKVPWGKVVVDEASA